MQQHIVTLDFRMVVFKRFYQKLMDLKPTRKIPIFLIIYTAFSDLEKVLRALRSV